MNKKLLQIHFERKAEKFFDKNAVRKDEISDLIIKAVKKLSGQDENVDVRLLKGNYRGYLRIRKGDLRIVFNVIEDENAIFVTITNIDFRGNVYK